LHGLQKTTQNFGSDFARGQSELNVMTMMQRISSVASQQ
jgi:hypothetical protein